MNWRANTLDILGLSETEMKILEVLSTARGVQEIANLTEISRTGVNYCLKILRGKNLVFVVKQGKRRLYVGAVPSQVSSKLQSAIDELTLASGDKKGARVKASKTSEFIIYSGIREIIPAHERIASMNKDERIRAIQPNKSWMNVHKKLGPRQLTRFNNAIKENGIIIDGILQADAYRKYGEFFRHDQESLDEVARSFSDRMADYTTVSEKFFNYNAEIWIYTDTVFIINWQEEVAIEIRNPDIMNFFRDMYEIVKESGQKIDHNQMMREIVGK